MLVLLLLPLQFAVAADTNVPVLAVRGKVEQSLALSLAYLKAMPRITLKAREKDGDEATFEGVTLSELVKRAKPWLTEKCCGNAANTCVIVRAADNYRVVFSFAEIDSDFTERKVLLADRRDGKPLPESQGPLRLIVPDDRSQTELQTHKPNEKIQHPKSVSRYGTGNRARPGRL